MPVTPASPFELAVVVLALLLPLACVPGLESPTFTPELAVLAVLLALGLPRLVELGWRGRYVWPARALLVFLALALASALSSKSPLVGVFGLYDWGTGWLFWCAVASCFALGASVGASARQRIGDALVAAACLNAILAVAQVAGNLNTGLLSLYNATQADGALGNPIYLEALLVGGLVLVCWRACESRVAWALAAPLLAAGLELSRERLAIVLVTLLAIGIVARFRSRASVVTAAAVAGGYLATWATSGVVARGPLAGAVQVGGTPRLLAWKLLVRAIAHHLLLGVGPGQTRDAFSLYETLAVARRIGSGLYFSDAHDVVLEVAVTTGLLGLAALAAFVAGVAAGRPRGSFLWVSVSMVVVELVEPMNVVILPLVALALGLALPAGTCEKRSLPGRAAGLGLARSVVRGGARAMLLVPALAAAVLLVVGDGQYGAGLRSLQLGEVRAASRLLPVWSVTAAAVATVDEVHADGAGDSRPWLVQARRAELTATDRDPGDPKLWAALGAIDLELGDASAALGAYRRAELLWPWWVSASMGLGSATVESGSSCAMADVWFERAMQADPTGIAPRVALARCRRSRGVTK